MEEEVLDFSNCYVTYNGKKLKFIEAVNLSMGLPDEVKDAKNECRYFTALVELDDGTKAEHVCNRLTGEIVAWVHVRTANLAAFSEPMRKIMEIYNEQVL